MQRARTITLSFTVLSAVYLYAFPAATIPYLALVLGHVAAGFVLAALLIPALRQARTVSWMVVATGAALGIALTGTGGSRPFVPLLNAHILVSAFGVVLLLASAMRRPRLGFAALIVAVLALAGSAWGGERGSLARG